MNKVRRFYVPMLSLVATGLLPAGAQTPARMPTDTELHAAACIPMVQFQLSLSREMLNSFDKNLSATMALPPEQRYGLETLQKGRQEAAQGVTETESALNRLQAYLLPRLMTLDALSIVAATNRGKADVQEIKSFADSCGTCTDAAITKNPQAPDYNACRANECKHLPVQDRAAACRNPSWLPF
jgi:hypothetical protein